MKTFVAVPVAVNPSRAIRQPRAAQFRLASKRSPLARFRRFIETTDWEKRYLCSRFIDKVCLGGIVASLLYFFPRLLSFVL